MPHWIITWLSGKDARSRLLKGFDESYFWKGVTEWNLVKSNKTLRSPLSPEYCQIALVWETCQVLSSLRFPCHNVLASALALQ